MSAGQKSYPYVIHKLDELGRRCGLQDDVVHAVSASDETQAAVKAGVKLAQSIKDFDIEKPNAEVEMLPLGSATLPKK